MRALYGECSPPLGKLPNCFPENSEPFMVGTDSCANAFAQVYNITAEPLMEVGRTNRDLSAACMESTNAVCSSFPLQALPLACSDSCLVFTLQAC